MTPEQVRSAAAKIAREHKPAEISPARWRSMDEQTKEEIRDEQRGERIAGEIIAAAIEAIPLPVPQPPSVDPFAEELAKALEGLINAAIAEVNERGAGGYMLARLSDARTALAAWRAKRGGQP